MSILLKLHYAKFGVSNLFFFSKVIEKKHLRCRLDPLGKGKEKGAENSYESFQVSVYILSIIQCFYNVNLLIRRNFVCVAIKRHRQRGVGGGRERGRGCFKCRSCPAKKVDLI